MELFASLVAIGAGILMILIMGVAIVLLWRGNEEWPLLLDALLRRQGDEAAHRARSSGHALAVAVQRCLACNQAAQCRAWLASGAHDGYQRFCPNAGYIEQMKRAHPS
jgi:Family of unknown function (DUF6455)